MSTIITNNNIQKIVSKIFKNVYSREVGGQNRAKFGLYSFWMTPNYSHEMLHILGTYFCKLSPL